MGSERWIAPPPWETQQGKEKKKRTEQKGEKKEGKRKKKRDFDRNLLTIIIKKLSPLRANVRASSRELSPSIPETVSNFECLSLHILVSSQGNWQMTCTQAR